MLLLYCREGFDALHWRRFGAVLLFHSEMHSASESSEPFGIRPGQRPRRGATCTSGRCLSTVPLQPVQVFPEARFARAVWRLLPGPCLPVAGRRIPSRAVDRVRIRADDPKESQAPSRPAVDGPLPQLDCPLGAWPATTDKAVA